MKNKIELIGGRYCGGFSHAKPDENTITIPVTNEMTKEATGKYLVYKRLDKKRFLFERSFSDIEVKFSDGPFVGKQVQVNSEDICVILGPDENGLIAAYKRNGDKWSFYKSFTSGSEADAFAEELKKKGGQP